MKVCVTGRNPENIVSLLNDSFKDFHIVDKNPDLVIAHGGDGTLLDAERTFPGVDKLPIRDMQTAVRCKDHYSLKNYISSFISNKLNKTELIKIAGFKDNQCIVGLNDIFIHNVDRGGALRYFVYLNDKPYGNEIIGDGVGISTVHGSTAYYRSITHSIFKIGIGLAFNNSTEVTNHLVLPEDTVIKIKITRGPAVIIADNSPLRIDVSEGEEVVLKKISKKAYIYGLEAFMCEECRKLRHYNRNN